MKLRPGDRGTKKLLAQYGSKLVCVRYRYDDVARKRFKTIELVVDEVFWKPEPPPNSKVFVKVKWNDKETQERIKQARGKWDKQRKLWILPFKKAKDLGLKSQIIGD